MDYKPIFRSSSLPYNQGEQFLAVHNKCTCDEPIPYKVKCGRFKPCASRFIVVNEMEFIRFNTESDYLPMKFSKTAIIRFYKYWKIIQPERSKRENSQCEMRCSEHCGNTVRNVQ